MDETVAVKKRRKRGEGREQDDREKKRSSGKEYMRKDNTLVSAKKLPESEVS